LASEEGISGYRPAVRKEWYRTPHEHPRALPARAGAAAGQVISPDREPRPVTRTDQPVDASSRPPGYGQRFGRPASWPSPVCGGDLPSRGGEGSPLPAAPPPARTARLVARLPDRPTRPRCLAKPRRVSSCTARPSPPRPARSGAARFPRRPANRQGCWHRTRRGQSVDRRIQQSVEGDFPGVGATTAACTLQGVRAARAPSVRLMEHHRGPLGPGRRRRWRPRILTRRSAGPAPTGVARQARSGRPARFCALRFGWSRPS